MPERANFLSLDGGGLLCHQTENLFEIHHAYCLAATVVHKERGKKFDLTAK